MEGIVDVTTTGSVDTNTVGTYAITYTASDSLGNTSEATRTVYVVDRTPPVITLIGDSIIEITKSSTYNDQGATAEDNVDGILTVTTTGSVDTNTLGTYIITYSATDVGGNTSTATRKVIVIEPDPEPEPEPEPEPDRIPPEITIFGQNPQTIEVFSSYSEPGVNAFDTLEGVVDVTTTGSVDTNTVGTYEITYSASDSLGNTSEAIRTVYVVDRTPPVITLNGESSIEIEVFSSYTELNATASDEYDGNVSVITSGTVNTNVVGTYTITYTATDSAGNSSSKTRTVNVVDTTGPAITVSSETSFEPSSTTGQINISANMTNNKKYVITLTNNTTQDLITIEEAYGTLTKVSNINVVNSNNGTTTQINNGVDITLDPGSYTINIPAASFKDDYSNTNAEKIFNFTVNALTPSMSNLSSITNSVLSHNITLSDKISYLPFDYLDLTVNTSTNSDYVNTIENINNGINISLVSSIQNVSRLDNTSFTIPIDFTVSNGTDSTTFNKELTVTNIYKPPVFQTITITPEIVKQTGQEITLAVEHRDTSYENLSIESASFTASSNYKGSLTSSLQSVSTNQTNVIVSFTLDQLDSGTKTLDITLKDNEQNHTLSKSLQVKISSPFVNVDYSQSLQNIVEFKQDNGDYLLNYKRKQTSNDVLQDSIIEIFNINTNDTVYMKISDNYYQLKKQTDDQSNVYFTLFNFENTSDRNSFINSVSATNTKAYNI